MAKGKLTNGRKPHPCSYRTNIQVEGINPTVLGKTSELRKNGRKRQRCHIHPCHVSHLMMRQGENSEWGSGAWWLCEGGNVGEEGAGSRVSLCGLEPRPTAELLWGLNSPDFPSWAFTSCTEGIARALPHRSIGKLNEKIWKVGSNLGNSKCL